jgi:hypothetical protein
MKPSLRALVNLMVRATSSSQMNSSARQHKRQAAQHALRLGWLCCCLLPERASHTVFPAAQHRTNYVQQGMSC